MISLYIHVYVCWGGDVGVIGVDGVFLCSCLNFIIVFSPMCVHAILVLLYTFTVLSLSDNSGFFHRLSLHISAVHVCSVRTVLFLNRCSILGCVFLRWNTWSPPYAYYYIFINSCFLLRLRWYSNYCCAAGPSCIFMAANGYLYGDVHCKHLATRAYGTFTHTFRACGILQLTQYRQHMYNNAWSWQQTL